MHIIFQNNFYRSVMREMGVCGGARRRAAGRVDEHRGRRWSLRQQSVVSTDQGSVWATATC